MSTAQRGLLWPLRQKNLRPHQVLLASQHGEVLSKMTLFFFFFSNLLYLFPQENVSLLAGGNLVPAIFLETQKHQARSWLFVILG